MPMSFVHWTEAGSWTCIVQIAANMILPFSVTFLMDIVETDYTPGLVKIIMIIIFSVLIR